ncbi:MAG TPA: hypothetical protein VIS03_09860 [Kiloniellaceae bacterium]
MSIRCAILSAAAILLAGCAGDPTIDREAAVTLEPMAKPASLPTELAWSGLGGGSEKLVSMENGVATWTQVEGNEAGCVWVDDGWFAPTSSWKGCTDADGTQEIVKSGDIWPLEIGKTESYKVKGQAGTDNWQSTHTCTVKAAVLVTVGEKQLPAYEVVCDDRWRVRTFYVSPELQRLVRYKNYHKKRGMQTDVSLVR